MTALKAIVIAAGIAAASTSAWAAALTPQEQLGKTIYFDNRLSEPAGQACAACHSQGAGFNGIGDANLAVYEGAVPGRFGNRNPPSAAYASFSPVFHYDDESGLYVGGQFWDGRAATLADQAKGPFLNPLEQNNPSAKSVILKVAISNYGRLFLDVCGPSSGKQVSFDKLYDCLAKAVAAYESSAEVNRFSSKFDLSVADTKYPLSALESKGLELFNGKGKCFACHPSKPGPFASKALFTDFTYDNLGIPKNPANPYYKTDPSFIDNGLGATVGDPNQNGKFKVPTLRNVAVAASYGHNGYFKTLKEIVHFYNTRDIGTEKWPAPEVPTTVNNTELGNLGLTEEEEDAIVAFMMTLTDGYAPPNPRDPR